MQYGDRGGVVSLQMTVRVIVDELKSGRDFVQAYNGQAAVVTLFTEGQDRLRELHRSATRKSSREF